MKVPRNTHGHSGFATAPWDRDKNVCPYCQRSMAEVPERGCHEHERERTRSFGPDRFVCPGCGAHATAGGWNHYCPECEAFVHFECMVKHAFTAHTCPICDTPLE